MDDREVHGRLAGLDELLEQLEQSPGRTAETALDAVAEVSTIYAEALRRVLFHPSAPESLREAVSDDELVAHLLVLHSMSAAPLAERIEAALEEVRPYVHSHGGEVELAAIEGNIARVRFSGTCDGCAASAATLQSAINDAVLAAAPELHGVQALAATAPSHPPPTSIPVSLGTKPAATGGPW